MKRKRFMLFLGWCTIVLNCIFMLLQKEQFVSIILFLFCGGLLTFLFVVEGRASISHDIRRAIAFSFDVGVLYLVFDTVKRCMDMAKLF